MRAKKIILSTLLFLFISFLNLYAVKNNKEVNLTLSFLLPSQEFATPFSAYYYDDKIYYRLPYNTLNELIDKTRNSEEEKDVYNFNQKAFLLA